MKGATKEVSHRDSLYLIKSVLSVRGDIVELLVGELVGEVVEQVELLITAI